MQIQIKQLFSGAQAATGLTVIIDTFRASNTILACLGAGAKSILPVAELDEACALKKQNPDHLLFGERKGLKPEGFDHGNSPAQATKLDLKGKDIILTTSAGSQGIVSAKQADEILIGSFSNVSAIVNYIQTKNPDIVSLVAIGRSGIEPAVEDNAVAEYLKVRLEGGAIDFQTLTDRVLQGDGAKRLRRLGQEEDLELCLELDRYEILPKLDRENGRIKAIR